jgi:hypothetical protein
MSTGRNGIVLNDQGGNRMDITDEVTCTLRAESHHPPCVMDTPAVIPLEHHPADNRIKIEESDAIQTLTSRMGTGGGNVPLVMSDEDTPVTLKIVVAARVVVRALCSRRISRRPFPATMTRRSLCQRSTASVQRTATP